jgi:hypothetical protein
MYLRKQVAHRSRRLLILLEQQLWIALFVRDYMMVIHFGDFSIDA